MARFPQPDARRGSQRWTQVLVREHADVLDMAIGLGPITWRSPLAEDDYAEYRDQEFLDRLGIELREHTLSDFWPSHGPQWDALGVAADGARVLVEAKAHMAEMFSPACRASEGSFAAIQKTLRDTAYALGARPGLDWTQRFYQYTNRLAHAHFLHRASGMPVALVFLYIIGDADMYGPRSRAEWEAAIETLREAIGLRGCMPPFVRDAFVDVSRGVPVWVGQGPRL